MAIARKLATYDDLLALPEDVRAEILAGEIVAQPSAGRGHQFITGRISRKVEGPFDFDGRIGGWWFMQDVDIRFTPHDVVRPDHAGWRQSRLASPYGPQPVEVIPDWICEILSTNWKYDRTYKSDLYATHGVGHYWLVDPVARYLEAFELKSGRWIRLGAYDESAIAPIPPFEALELKLSDIFGPSLPPT